MNALAWVVLFLWMGTAALGATLGGGRRAPYTPPPQAMPPNVREIERRDLGVNRDGLHWYAFLVYVDSGPWVGWYAERAIGWTEEVVVGGCCYDDELEARAVFETLEAP